MTVSSSLLQQLQIQHPIFLAPMAGVSTPALAAEVSNAGGLGSLGLGASSIAVMRAQIEKTQSLTDKPFQVNFFCHQPALVDAEQEQVWIDYLRPQFARFNAEPPQTLRCIYPSFLDNDDALNLVLEMGVKAVSFHFGIPHAHQIQALKNAGVITMVSATSVAEAKAIEAAGIDIIIAQGIEAGGHRGIFNPTFDSSLSTLDLVQLITTHCALPVVAAGGIMNGAQAKAAFAKGAAAVQLGTAFVPCSSSNANAAYRAALFSDTATTQITAAISGRPARGLVANWQLEVDVPNRPSIAAYPYAYDLGKQLNDAAAKQGEFGYGAFWAGSNVTQIRQLEAAELIAELLQEMAS